MEVAKFLYLLGLFLQVCGLAYTIRTNARFWRGNFPSKPLGHEIDDQVRDVIARMIPRKEREPEPPTRYIPSAWSPINAYVGVSEPGPAIGHQAEVIAKLRDQVNELENGVGTLNAELSNVSARLEREEAARTSADLELARQMARERVQEIRTTVPKTVAGLAAALFGTILQGIGGLI